MVRRAVPAALALTAFVADLAGHHQLARLALFVAIPLAFALMLDWYGDAVEAGSVGVRPFLAGAALFLLVLSAALRSPAVVGGVPRLAESAVGACLVLYGVLATHAVLAAGHEVSPRQGAALPETAAETQRLADAA